MLVQQTMEKLKSLRLSGMARAFQEEMEQGKMCELSFEERFGLLVDREWYERQNRRLNRRIKAAKLKTPACVEDIDYTHRRGLDRQVMRDLISCRWISAKRNLIITGATGVGKTWIACALAEKACREGFKALYTRIPRLIHELSISRADGSYLKFLAKLAKLDLLILDDWGIATLKDEEQQDLLEVVDDRANNRSTLVTSQFPVDKWHDTIGDPSVADAILDRLVQCATIIQLKGESMRKAKRNTDNQNTASNSISQ